MTASAPWFGSLTEVDSVANTSLHDPKTDTTYVFSDNFTRLAVTQPPQNGYPARYPRTTKFSQPVRPISFLQNSHGLDGHNHGIVGWKIVTHAKSSALVAVFVNVLTDSLRTEDLVLFTSANLRRWNEIVDPASVLSLLSELQGVYFVSETQFVLNTGKQLYLLTTNDRQASILPLPLSSIPMDDGLVHSPSKHTLQFVALRPTSRPGVYLLVLYYPLSDRGNMGPLSLVIETHGQLVAIEVGLSVGEQSAAFTREDGMVAAPLPAHTFTHSTAFEFDEVHETYIFVLAERSSLDVYEMHTKPSHAHQLDVRSQSVLVKSGILPHRMALENAIPQTVLIVTSHKAGWGIEQRGYEVLVKSSDFMLYRVKGGDGKFENAVTHMRLEDE
jgi:hypothetical protein